MTIPHLENSTATPARPDLVAAARHLTKAGVPVAPVRLVDSGFPGIPGYYEANYPVGTVTSIGADLLSLFGCAGNLGVELGDPRGGYCEVLLANDQITARLASALLPASTSWIDGDVLHILYRSPSVGGASIYPPGAGRPIISIKTVGVTLVPPFTTAPLSLVNIAAPLLSERVSILAAGAAIAKQWPVGNEHAVRALAGAFCESGLLQEEASRLGHLIFEVSGDASAKAAFTLVVDRTYRLAAHGDHYIAWRELENHTSLGVVAFGRPLLKVDRALTITVPVPIFTAPSDEVQSAPEGESQSDALALTATLPSAAANETIPNPTPVSTILIPTIAAAFYDTDSGNARYLVNRHGWSFLSVPKVGDFGWDERRWLRDETGAFLRAAQETVHFMAAQARAAKDENAISHAQSSEGIARLKAMVSLARIDSRIVCPTNQLDNNRWLLNVLDGTIDLRTGIVYPHNRANRISKLAPYRANAKNRCPRWLNFLDRIFAGNVELIRFVQRSVGYSLTGIVDEHALFILLGGGSNGKSTFLFVIKKLLGDFALQADPDLLLARHGEVHPTGFTELLGVRFAIASEVNARKFFDEANVKRLTGADPITARRMRQDFITWDPTHHLWLGVNAMPRMLEGGEPMRRRLKAIPFDVAIPKNEQNIQLAHELLYEEATGILRWALEGCLEWQQQGLNSPLVVRNSVEKLLESANPILVFIEECCVRGDTLTCLSSSLYQAYTAWAKANGEIAESSYVFSQSLTGNGFPPHKGAQGVRYRLGLTLKGAAGALTTQMLFPS